MTAASVRRLVKKSSTEGGSTLACIFSGAFGSPGHLGITGLLGPKGFPGLVAKKKAGGRWEKLSFP